MLEVDYDNRKNCYTVVADPLTAWGVKDLTCAKLTNQDDKGLMHFEVPGTYAASVQMGTLADVPRVGRPGPPLTLDLRLSPLQEDGVRFLARGSGMLFDEMGVGKTVQTCAALEAGDLQTALVVVTKSTLYSWLDHIHEWSPSWEVFVLHGSAGDRRREWSAFQACTKRKVLLTTHDMVYRHSEWINYGKEPKGAPPEPWLSDTAWALMVVDEAHKFRSPKGKTFRALCAIRRKTRQCWLLTGTPVEDSPDDMWQYLRLVDPATFQYRSRFRDRYCRIEPLKWGGVENQGIRPEMRDEYSTIVDGLMVRRFRREVWPELPEALPPEYRLLTMTPTQAKAYREMAKEMMTTIEDDLLIATDPVTVYQKLDYISTGMPILDDEGNVTALSPKGSNKLEAILDIAEERNGDPFVVYAPSRRVIEMLAEGMRKAGYTVGLITGKVSAEERAAYIAAFQAGKLNVMLMTSAGAEGVTLTAADLLVYCDLDWSLRKNQQVAARIDRHGQGRRPQQIILMSKDTVDVSRRYTVEEKGRKQEDILRDSEQWERIINGTFTD